MASTREIRRRIRSVRNISQITRAMEMVSASKMRRAQLRVVASRPYADRIFAMIGDLAYIQRDQAEMSRFPLMASRPVQNVGLVLVTPDKGLTGPLNSNILRRSTRFILDDAAAPVRVIAVGRKGRDFMLRSRQDVIAEFTGIRDQVTFEEIRPITQLVIEEFTSGRVDAVYMVYARFVNTLTQVPEMEQLLPVVAEESAGTYNDFIFEPDDDDVLNALLPRSIETNIYQAVLESVASEHSARMVAMRNASENASDLVSELTLTYNKARQAQITREVSEIAAGANALREKD